MELDAAPAHGANAAAAYGWDALIERSDATWQLDAYVSLELFDTLQERLNRLDIDDDASDKPAERDSLLLPMVDEPWPFPPHYPLAPQPLV